MNSAPLLIAYAIRRGRPLQFEMGMTDVADPRTLATDLNGVTQLTQWYNDALERMIRRTPEQYWWVHRRWKGEPPRKRKQPSSQAA